jgi:hypothetical protein
MTYNVFDWLSIWDILILLELPSRLGIFEVSERVSPCELGAKACQLSHGRHPGATSQTIQESWSTAKVPVAHLSGEPILRPTHKSRLLK